MRTSWNDEEDEALDYLPHVDQVIYLRGIRRRMDFRTGVAGESAPISYTWLSQLVEVHSAQGSHRESERGMTKSALRASFARLEAAGLVKRVSEASGRGLIFRCLLADRGNLSAGGATPERPLSDPIRATPCASGKNNNLHEVSDPGATPCCTAMNDPIPVSGIREEEDPPIPPKGRKPSASSWVLPEGVDPAAWEDFEAHRKAKGGKFTDLARAKNAAVLVSLTPEQQRASVDDTIRNNWTGLFAPKGSNGIHHCPQNERDQELSSMVIKIYCEVLPELDAPIPARWELSAASRQLIERIKENPQHKLPEFWREYFSIVRSDPWCMGDNGKGFKADLPYLVSLEPFNKITTRLYNKYRQRAGQAA